MSIHRLAATTALLSTLLASTGYAANETVAYTFGPFTTSYPASGAEPEASLLSTMGGQVFYGTATMSGVLADGTQGAGTLFRIQRAPGGMSSAKFTVLHTFNAATEGGYATGTPVTDGVSLFGTLSSGPTLPLGNSLGAIYQWTQAAAGKAGGALSIIHVFDGTGSTYPNGSYPRGALLRASDGTLYGAAEEGGLPEGYGLIFALSPPAAGQTIWTYSVLYEFTGGADGYYPRGGLVQDASGTLYGATQQGGTGGGGTVFSLKPPAPGQTGWTETTIAGFKFGDKVGPVGANTPLLLDTSGAIFATSYSGGSSGLGTVFKLTPPLLQGATWTTSVLFSFTGPNGESPFAPLIADLNGTLYSTTTAGGSRGRGTVFSLATPADGGTLWAESDLLDFAKAPNRGGANPYGGLAVTATGQLIGTTQLGGLNDTGVIYLLKP